MRARTGLLLIVVGLELIAGGSATAQTFVTNFPVADAFVRSMVPTNNYGGAGSSAVSGSIATNVLGQQQGLLDTFMRFDLSAAVSNLNSNLGTGKWTFSGAKLHLFEQGSPNNVVFNRGVGPFEVRWVASDSWVEGTGTPNAPTADGIVWNDEASLLNSLVDQSLGSFTNNGSDGLIKFALSLPPTFANDIASGGLVSLLLTATSNSMVGFTFRSRSFSDPAQWPFLEIAAVATPQITSVNIAGGNVEIRFNTSGSVTNTVEYKDDLAATNWNPLTSLLGLGGNTNVFDIGGASLSKRFYRVKLTLPP